jgi:hypothetical protein
MSNAKIVTGIASLGLGFGVLGSATVYDLPQAIAQTFLEQAPLEQILHVQLSYEQLPHEQLPHEQLPHKMPSSASAAPTGQFQRIEQPLSHRLAVTVGGLGLIGLELWWFLLSKPKSRKAQTESGVQVE